MSQQKFMTSSTSADLLSKKPTGSVPHPPNRMVSSPSTLSATGGHQPVMGHTQCSSAASDRITRFASPNRFDSLDAPNSFLDSRGTSRSRSSTRPNLDRITLRATPEYLPNHDLMVESSMPQSYQTSGSAVLGANIVATTRSLPVRRHHHQLYQPQGGGEWGMAKQSLTHHPGVFVPSTRRGLSQEDVLDCDKRLIYPPRRQSSVSDRLNTIELRLQRLKDQRTEEHEVSRRVMLLHQTNQMGGRFVEEAVTPKVYRSEATVPIMHRAVTTPVDDSAATAPESTPSPHQHPPASSSLQRRASASSTTSSGGPPPTGGGLQPPVSKDPPASPSGRIGGSKRAPGDPKPEIKLVHSKVHTRVLIQSDTATQAKTLNYYNGDHHGDDTGSHGDTLRLDELASQMGLLGCGGPRGGGGVTSRPPKSGGTSPTRAFDESTTATAAVGSPPVPLASVPAPVQTPSPTPPEPAADSTSTKAAATGTPKRGRSSLLNSLLRRLSPRLKRRSKSTSPSRATGWSAVVDGDPMSSSSAGEPAAAPAARRQSGGGRSFHHNPIKRLFNKLERREKKTAKNAGGPRGSISSSDAIKSDVQSDASWAGEHDVSSSAEPTSSLDSPNGQCSTEPSRNSVDHSGPVVLTNGAPDYPSKARPKDLYMDSSPKIVVAANNSGGRSSCGNTPLRTSENCEISTTPTRDSEGPKHLNLTLSAFGYGSYYGAKSPSEPQATTTTTTNSSPPATATSSPMPPTPIKSSGDPQVTMRRKSREHLLNPRRPEDEGEEGSPPGLMTMSVYQRQCSNKEEEDFDNIRRKRTRSSSDGKEATARARSSLIMLAVSHGSPRGKLAPPTATSGGLMLPSPAMQHRSLECTTPTSASTPGEGLSGRHQGLGLATTPLMEHVSSPENSPSLTSPTVVTPGNTSEQPIGTVAAADDQQASSGRDGNSFLAVVEETEVKLQLLIDATERDLDFSGHLMAEEVCGQLRCAAGKASLLISEKMVQFRGLCDQNMASGGRCDVEFATLSNDLEGFWAMVMLQVDDVTRLFTEVDELRNNAWTPKEALEVIPAKSNTPIKSKPRRPAANKAKVNKDELAARAEARKRIQTARREAMAKMQKEKQQQQHSDTHSSKDIVIFA